VERLRRLNEAAGIPLAIQGVSGRTDEQYRRLIQHGVARIDCAEVLARAAGERLRTAARGDYASLVQELREAIGAEVEQCLHRWGSAGRAAEVLVQCRGWQPVEHVILYNVEGADDTRIGAMMARGREVLAQIPGVRRVITGWAVADKPKYRCCWLVEFASRAVIDSYRQHPLHVQFADQLFRPLAADRVTIDFETVDREPVVAVARRASG
jgi:fructose-bisphosphate aldolase class II